MNCIDDQICLEIERQCQGAKHVCSSSRPKPLNISSANPLTAPLHSPNLPIAFGGETPAVSFHMLSRNARLRPPKAAATFACHLRMSLLDVSRLPYYSRLNAADAPCAREKSRVNKQRPTISATNSPEHTRVLQSVPHSNALRSVPRTAVLELQQKIPLTNSLDVRTATRARRGCSRSESEERLLERRFTSSGDQNIERQEAKKRHQFNRTLLHIAARTEMEGAATSAAGSNPPANTC